MNPGSAGAAAKTAGRPGPRTRMEQPGPGTVAVQARAEWLRELARRDEADVQALVAVLTVVRLAAA